VRLENIHSHHRSSNPGPSGLQHNASTTTLRVDVHIDEFTSLVGGVASFTAALHPRGKSRRHPSHRSRGGPQSRSTRRGEDKHPSLTGKAVQLLYPGSGQLHTGLNDKMKGLGNQTTLALHLPPQCMHPLSEQGS
jgi:hypothetical protein